MATNTIGTAQTYATIAAWATAIKAIGTLTENEIGEYAVDEVATYGSSSDLDFSGVTLDGFTITLRAASGVKHDGDFGNGARIESAVSTGQLYQCKNLIIEDMSFKNTEASGGGARVLNAIIGCTMKRVIGWTVTSTVAASDVFTVSAGQDNHFEACRAVAGDRGWGGFGALSGSINNCTATGCGAGFSLGAGGGSYDVQNCVAYNITNNDFTYTSSGTSITNASEDGTAQGTGEVTISGDPFDADGYTPAASGQLDGVGTDLSISLDAANNSFEATPSIGAYEVVSAGAAPGGGSSASRRIRQRARKIRLG